MTKRNAKLAIATFVTDFTEYQEMKDSFHAAGFSEPEVLFHAVDNSTGNQGEPYSGIAQFCEILPFDYLIVTHQDVRAVDSYDDLQERLAELTAKDPEWAVAGNAGFSHIGGFAACISDPHSGPGHCTPGLPKAVKSLDENLLFLNGAHRVVPNPELSGFHFYGPDLCIRAWQKGLHAYVINWHVQHLSGGHRSQSFYECRDALEAAYRQASPRIIQTTCDVLFLGPTRPLRGLRRLLFRLGLFLSK